MACYMLWVGVGLVKNNVRALMKLPLPEEHQLTITPAPFAWARRSRAGRGCRRRGGLGLAGRGEPDRA